ncbi:MAG: fibronectin type III domain-containing protein, partial [Pyrinomonadaceae bacterium]
MFKATKSFRFIVVLIAIVAMSTLAISANFGSGWITSLFTSAEAARQDSNPDKTKIAPALEDRSENQEPFEQKYDADGNKIEMAVADGPTPSSNDLITSGTYAFSSATGATLEDMSSGTVSILGNNLDDNASGLTMIPFDFWFDGVRANQFSVNANGLMRLGNTVIGTTFSNSMGSTTNSPQLAPYWDDLWIGFNGKVHFKTVGTAPNRKLVVEWQNMQVPRVANGSTGGATYQAWLYEGTGVIEYVYGSGLAVNSANGGYSVGIQSGVATNFAAVTTATGTVSYAAANDTQTGAIAAGTKYTFTPVAPTAPTGLNFTAVTGTSQTLNWTDNSSNEAGFLIYRSTDGVNYTFITQTAANAVTSIQNNLGNNQTYSWRVIAVSEGANSTTLSGSQATTTGTVSGTKSVGPTGDYASLTAAFADMTTNGLAGNVILELQATYLSAVETFPIVPSVNGSPSATITVRPAAGATGLSISGTNATAIFDFGGSSYVTIDGQPGGAGGVKDMTISNTNVSGSAVRFINGASSNTLRFLQIRGVSTSTTAGVVNFSTSTAVTGNNNNTITNNDVRDGTTAPVNGVSSTGTTTLGLENNKNTVSNNNIFNFFSATGDHNGLLLGSGNTNWTVSGNSIYNTNGPLNVTTTSVVWNGIRMSSATGSWGHNVTGNFIGGTLPSGGGGALTFTGGGVIRATQLTTGSQISTSLQGNTIGNFNLTSISTATGGAGLGMVTGAYNAGDITPNIVSNWTLNITGAASLWRGISVGTGTAATTVVANNVVSNITCPSTHVAQVQGLGVQGSSGSSGVMTISGNTIGSTTLANNISMSSAAVSFFGIPSSVAWTATTNYLNNTVANVTSTGTGAFNMIGMSISGGGYNISGNTIRNLTTASTTTASTVVGINATATTSNTQFLSQNNIRSLSMTAPAAGVVGFGIIYTGPVTPATAAASTVSRNIVHSISTPSTTTTAALEGIRITAGNATFQNNMVRLGFLDDGTPTSITNGIAINGISETGGTNNIYHNSVYIGGTGVVSASNTTAFFSSLTSGTRAYRDNLFVNNRQNASGTATNTGALFGTALTLPSPTGLTMSNNVYFSFDPAATVRNGSAGTSYSLAGWQGASAVDANSIYASLANINFVAANGTSSTVDLHVASPTVIEGTGVDVGVLDDFDGQTRSGLTPVDVGADAGAFTAVDLAPPAITYTAFTNTTSTVNRILGITATDATGVDQTASFLPRVYFKKLTDVSYVSTQCVSSGGTAQNGTYNCTIDYTLVGGASVIVGDTVQYYVVAQDTAGNVGSNPAGAVGTNVNTISTPPTPNAYNISAAVSGTINVGTGPFTSLTRNDSAGIFKYLNDNVVTGDVIINVTGDLLNEDGAVALNAFASPWTVTIKPDTTSVVPRTISGPAAGVTMIRLNGASRVTIDGSSAVNGTDRSLTIENTSATATGVIRVGSIGTTPITNTVIKNSIIRNGVNTSSAIVVLDTAGSVAGYFNNLTIQNNSLEKAFVGMFINTTVSAGNGTGLLVTGNNADAAGVNAIRNVGLYVQGAAGTSTVAPNVISNNTVGNFENVTAEADTGIWLATGAINTTVSGNTVTALGYSGTSAAAPIGINVTSAVASTNNNIIGNSVSNISTNGSTNPVRGISVTGATADVTIQKNNVQGIINTSTGSWPAYGMDISGGNNIVVKNNFVSNVSGDMTGGVTFSTTNGIFGIRVGAGTGHQIYNNSVNLYGLRTGTANSGMLTAAFGIVSTASTGIDVRNNIFANNITGGTTSIANVSVYLPTGGTSAMNLTWNNNSYYYGTDVARSGPGQAGTTAGTNFFTTFDPTVITPASNLRSYTSTLIAGGLNDNASLGSTGAVPFTSATDLHILLSAPEF